MNTFLRFLALPGFLAAATLGKTQIPDVVVTYADAKAVVSSEFEVTAEVIYWVRNAEAATLDIKLPPGARLVTEVYVDSDSQKPKFDSKRDTLTVKLPGSGALGAWSVPVRVLYELKVAPGSHNFPGSRFLTIPEPSVGNVEVLRSRFTLYLPEEEFFYDFDSNMRLPTENLGWRWVRNSLDVLVPSDRPREKEAEVIEEEAPGLPYEFSVPLVAEGRAFEFHRLDGPAPITASFFPETCVYLVRAGLFLVAFAIGLLLLKAGPVAKCVYFLLIGMPALIAAGMVTPPLAPVFGDIFIGAVLAVAAWLAVGLCRWVCSGFKCSKPEQAAQRPVESAPPASHTARVQPATSRVKTQTPSAEKKTGPGDGTQTNPVELKALRLNLPMSQPVRPLRRPSNS